MQEDSRIGGQPVMRWRGFFFGLLALGGLWPALWLPEPQLSVAFRAVTCIGSISGDDVLDEAAAGDVAGFVHRCIKVRSS